MISPDNICELGKIEGRSWIEVSQDEITSTAEQGVDRRRRGLFPAMVSYTHTGPNLHTATSLGMRSV